ncbi:MAG: 6-bladed beta-propeller, partial [bacterium]
MRNKNRLVFLLIPFLVFLLGANLFSDTTPDIINVIPKNINELNSPIGVAVSGDKIYVTNIFFGKVQVFDKNSGKLLNEFGKRGMGRGKLSLPWDIVIGKNKKIYVSDLGQHRI